MALIRLRDGDETLGLLQLNDRRKNRFTPELIAFLENAADQIAIGLSQRQAEAALKESEMHYRSLFENMLNGFAFCKMLFEGDRPRDFIYLDVNAAFETSDRLEECRRQEGIRGHSRASRSPMPRCWRPMAGWR